MGAPSTHPNTHQQQRQSDTDSLFAHDSKLGSGGSRKSLAVQQKSSHHVVLLLSTYMSVLLIVFSFKASQTFPDDSSGKQCRQTWLNQTEGIMGTYKLPLLGRLSSFWNTDTKKDTLNSLVWLFKVFGSANISEFSAYRQCRYDRTEHQWSCSASRCHCEITQDATWGPTPCFLHLNV